MLISSIQPYFNTSSGVFQCTYIFTRGLPWNHVIFWCGVHYIRYSIRSNLRMYTDKAYLVTITVDIFVVYPSSCIWIATLSPLIIPRGRSCVSHVISRCKKNGRTIFQCILLLSVTHLDNRNFHIVAIVHYTHLFITCWWVKFTRGFIIPAMYCSRPLQRLVEYQMSAPMLFHNLICIGIRIWRNIGGHIWKYYRMGENLSYCNNDKKTLGEEHCVCWWLSATIC